jgi:hypothetical protein
VRVANDEHGLGPNGWAGANASRRGLASDDPGGRVATDACLLWCLRRLAVITQQGSVRCPMVHITLQRQFGDAGLGIEHLLRCLVMGLAMHATRRLAFGVPGCPLRTDDENALLALLTDDRQAPETMAAVLVGVGGAAAAVLLPLVVALREWLRPAP